MRTVAGLRRHASFLMAHNPRGSGDNQPWDQPWDAVHAVLNGIESDVLSKAVGELLEAAVTGDRDARNVVQAFRMYHPPGALGNPEWQKQLLGLYLIFSENGLWQPSSEQELRQFKTAVRQMFE